MSNIDYWDWEENASFYRNKLMKCKTNLFNPRIVYRKLISNYKLTKYTKRTKDLKWNYDCILMFPFGRFNFKPVALRK
jgi:hypothetical protein